MTAAPAIVSHHTGDLRTKGVQFQPICNLCRESSRYQLWLPVLLLSFASIHACAAAANRLTEVKSSLTKLRTAIESSDAMLYSPSADDIPEHCKGMSLRCYILELMMVIEEQEITGANAESIFDYNDHWLPKEYPADCLPCEAYSLKNITIFLDRFHHLLEELISSGTREHM